MIYNQLKYKFLILLKKYEFQTFYYNFIKNLITRKANYINKFNSTYRADS